MISNEIQVVEEEDRYLAEIPEARLQAVFAAPDGLIPIVETIENLVRQFTPDISTAKGREKVRSLAYKVTRSKTFLDELGKGLVADLKELPKRIDANRKVMRDRLDSLAEEARRPLTEYEERIEAHQNRLKMIADMPSVYSCEPSAEIAKAIEKLQHMPTGAAQWEEFQQDAINFQTDTLKTLNEMFIAKKRAEDEAAELERLRAAAAERERQDAIRKAAEEARAQAQREEADRQRMEREAAAHREADAKRRQEEAERQAREAEARLAEAKRLSDAREAEYQRQKADAELYEKAIAEVRALPEVGASFMQRTFGVTYARAIALLDKMESAGIISPAESTGKRKVLLLNSTVQTESTPQPEAPKPTPDREHFRQVNSEVAKDIEAVIVDACSNQDIARAVVIAIAKGKIRHTTITY